MRQRDLVHLGIGSLDRIADQIGVDSALEQLLRHPLSAKVGLALPILHEALGQSSIGQIAQLAQAYDHLVDAGTARLAELALEHSPQLGLSTRAGCQRTDCRGEELFIREGRALDLATWASGKHGAKRSMGVCRALQGFFGDVALARKLWRGTRH